MVTTACNAATMPVIGPYLDELQKWLSAKVRRVGADDALERRRRVRRRRRPHPDPAGRERPGRRRARRQLVRRAARRADRLLCFDMGGTTAKACLIDGGEPELTNVFEVARAYRFKKGSGSRARSRRSTSSRSVPAAVRSPASTSSDSQGRPRVGRMPNPDRRRTAAAAPSRPSPTPTCCSACSTPPRSSAATCRSTRAAASAAAAGVGAGRSASTTIQVAAGIHEIVNQNMAAAARMHAVEQGVDLRGVAPARVRRRRAGARLRRRRTARVRPCRSSPSTRACCRRSAPSCRRSASTSPGRCHAGSTRIDPTERDALLDESPRRRAPRARRGRQRPGTHMRFRYGVDARYAGQGNEVTVWVGEGETRGRRRRRRARRVRGRVPPDLRTGDPRRPDRDRHLAPVGVGRRRAGRIPNRSPTGAGAAPFRVARSCSGEPRTRSTRRCTGGPTSAPGDRSPVRRSSRSARPPRVIRPGWHVEVGRRRQPDRHPHADDPETTDAPERTGDDR